MQKYLYNIILTNIYLCGTATPRLAVGKTHPHGSSCWYCTWSEGVPTDVSGKKNQFLCVCLAISCKGSYKYYELLTQLLQRLQAFNSMVTKLEQPWRSIWSLQSFMMTLRPPNWKKIITKNKNYFKNKNKNTIFQAIISHWYIKGFNFMMRLNFLMRV